MARRAWAWTALVVLLALGADVASAHDFRIFRFGGKTFVVLEHSGGPSKFTMRVGEKLTLIVHDVNDPPCTARITVNAVVGATATITPPGSTNFVRDQPFVVAAKSLGVTTFQIRVQGEAAKPGGRAECNEDSVNDVEVTVLPDPAAAEAQAAEFAKQIVKNTKSSLTSAFNALKSSLGGLKADIKDGDVTPTNGACLMLDTYYDALRAAAVLRREAVGDFREQIMGDLTLRGFDVTDEPRGVLPGYRAGAWQTGLRNIGSPVRQFFDKVRNGLTKDAALLERTYDTASIPWKFNYECCCCDCCCDPPYPPTISTAFALAVAVRTRLELGVIGAISTRDSSGAPVGYLWVVGHGDATKGDVQADVLAGDGTTTTKVGSIGPDGKFRFDFEELATGRLYQVQLKYVGSTSEYGIEKRFIDMPYIPN